MISILALALLTVILLASCAQATTTPAAGQGSTTLDGQSLMQARCTVCHSTDRIMQAHKTVDQWKTTVERMLGKDAKLNSQEQQVLIDYLAQTHP